jgi:hypothetical protein
VSMVLRLDAPRTLVERNADTVSRHRVRGQTPAQALSVNARITCRVIGCRITFFQGLPSATRLACASRHTLFGENAPLGSFLILVLSRLRSGL